MVLLGVVASAVCAGCLVPDRRFCWRDIGANTAGTVFAAAAAQLYVTFFRA